MCYNFKYISDIRGNHCNISPLIMYFIYNEVLGKLTIAADIRHVQSNIIIKEYIFNVQQIISGSGSSDARHY